MNVAVIGAGNGGQSIAGFLAMQGHKVNLFDRKEDKIKALREVGGITLEGQIKGFGSVNLFTSDLCDAVKGTELIMVITTANAHKDIATNLAPYLENGQTIVLNPGRTCGALEFRQYLNYANCKKRIYLAEAQTLVYACRIIEPGHVNIIGVKKNVPLAALPASDNQHVLNTLKPLYPCFFAANSVLQTSLENIGAIFHPCVLLFNIATIERNTEFYFYREMTPQVANFIERFDGERIAVGKAYGIDLMGVNEWISFTYEGTKGTTLIEKMRSCPGYHDIKSPSSIFSRQLTEDIPTGVLPIMQFGRVAGLKMTLMESMINICSAVLDMDLIKDGRTLEHLGIANLDMVGILNYIYNNE